MSTLTSEQKEFLLRFYKARGSSRSVDLAAATAAFNEPVMNVTQDQLDHQEVPEPAENNNATKAENLSPGFQEEPLVFLQLSNELAGAADDNAANRVLSQGSRDGPTTSMDALMIRLSYVKTVGVPTEIEQQRFVFYWRKKGYTFKEIAELYTHMYYKKKGSAKWAKGGSNHKKGGRAKRENMNKNGFRAKVADMENLYSKAHTDLDVIDGPFNYPWADGESFEDPNGPGQHDPGAMGIDGSNEEREHQDCQKVGKEDGDMAGDA